MVVVHGTVSAGYEPVREAFRQQLVDGRAENAQVCAYVGREKVVDLWASLTGKSDKEYNGDSFNTVFSSTKTVCAIVFACLADKGLVDYEEKIATYWPEFAKQGKEDVKVMDVLRHESGLGQWKGKIKFVDTLTDNIKQNSIGKVIEEETLSFPSSSSGSKREYHGITRGYILNEIFRRVHPEGKTIGEYLKTEIAGPLGIDVYIGAPEQGAKNHPLSTMTSAQVFLNSMMPGFLSRKVEYSALDFISLGKAVSQQRKDVEPRPDRKMAPYNGLTAKDLQPTATGATLDNVILRRGETPSANGACSARGLAKLGACIINKGEFNGVRIMSEKGVDALHKNPTAKKDAMFPDITTCFSQGGVNFFKEHPGDNLLAGRLNALREGYVGWHGFGGSVFQWHPELGISFAYVPTQLCWYDMANSRGGELQQVLADCVKRKKAHL